MDDVEEANLSEYNGSSAHKNSCDRYSDLKASQNDGSGTKKERSNSNIEMSLKKNVEFEERKKNFSDAIILKEEGSLRGSA